jgi:hypothetical protein
VKFSDLEADAKNVRGKEGYDPILKIHLLVSHMKDRCRSLLQPEKYISVDEKMLRYKGCHHMKQCIPSKPKPYGFKLWALADSNTGYLVDFNVYCGASDTTRKGLSTDCVLELMDPGPGLNWVLGISSV